MTSCHPANLLSRLSTSRAPVDHATLGHVLERPDVARRVPGDAPLVGGRADGVVTGVDGRTASQQRVGQRGPAVVGQRTKTGIGYHLVGGRPQSRSRR